MAETKDRKRLKWIGSSLSDLKDFPAPVRRVMGQALDDAQVGGKHPDAKPLKGFKGAGVLEVVDDHDGDTYRAVYTVKFGNVVYVLHAFKKKSRKGIATPQKEIDLIKKRYKYAQEVHKAVESKRVKGAKKKND